MIKTMIFDMDGTVLNTIDSIAHWANLALNKYDLPSIEPETYKVLVGEGARTLVERMIKTVGADETKTDAVFAEYSSTYDADFLYLTKPYDGVLEMMDALIDMGVKCAILTNKPQATAEKISKELFGDRISLLIGGRPGKPLKPDPSLVPEMLQTLGVKAEECWYAGDTATDMKTGTQAGLFTVGVLWGFRSREELEQNGADLLVSQAHEITEQIRLQNNG